MTSRTRTGGHGSVRRIALLLLIAGLLLLGACTAPAAADTKIVTSAIGLSDAIKTASGDRTILLYANIDVQDSLFLIDSGKRITLRPQSGSSYTIGKTRATSSSSGATGVFTIEGGCSLTLAGNGGGTITINGGSMSNNYAPLVWIDSGGTFTLEAGTLTSNRLEGSRFGAGVYLGGGSFVMTGGTITNNYGVSPGGGVFVNGGSFTMTGGTISGNTVRSDSNGAGVYVNSGSFTMGGTAVIAADNELYLNSGMSLSSGSFTGSANNIDGSSTVISNGYPLIRTSGTASTYLSQFTLQNTNYGLVSDSTNQNILVGSTNKLTVVNGTGTGSYAAGTRVTITANTIPGFTFREWTSSSGSFANSTSPTTTFTMPAAAVTVTALFDPTAYPLTVENGTSTGTGSYPAGDTVTITANNTPGYTFREWTSTSSVTFANPAAETTTLEMPAAAVTVTAELRPHTYTVRYDGSSATGGTTGDSTHTYDLEQQLTANGFTKTGYTFAGWNTTAGGTIVDYTDSQRVQNLTADDAATVTLHAVWTPITYTIHYDGSSATSGTTAPSTHTYDVEQQLTANGFSKDGYRFAGWNTTGTSGTGIDYQDKASVKNLAAAADAIVDLYAVWTPKTTDITLNGNDPTTAGTPSVTLRYGETTVPPITSPQKTGYTLEGWNTNNDGTGTTVLTTAGALTGDGIYSDAAKKWKWDDPALTLYAVWTETITLHQNGGTGGPTTVPNTYQHIPDPLPTPAAPDDYTFRGYAADTRGTTTIYDHTGAIRADVTGYTDADKKWTRPGTAAPLTLYAVWNQTVTLDANRGTPGPETTVTATLNASAPTLTTAGFPTRTGHTFGGYAADPAGTPVLYGTAGTPAQNIAGWTDASGRWTHTGPATLHAVWTPNTTRITLDGSGGTPAAQSVTVTYGDTTVPPVTRPQKTGYTFDGWNTTADGTGTRVLTTAGALTGDGTYSDAAGKWILDSPTLTLYAAWIGNTTEITLDGNDPATPGTTSVTVTYGSTTVPPITSPQKTGYDLGGWNTNNDGTGTTVLDSAGALTGDGTYSDAAKKWNWDSPTLTLSALWNQTITLHQNGGTGGRTTVPNTYQHIPDPLPTPAAPQGYTFQGYAADTRGTTTVYDHTGAIRADIAGYTDAGKKWTHPGTPVTLYAVWNQTVTLDANRGTPGSETSVVATLNASAPTLTTAGFPTRTGHTFGGYAADPAGTPVLYGIDGTPAQNIAGWTDASGRWTHTGPAVLSANWTAHTYTVTFHGNGSTGGGPMAGQPFTYGIAQNLTANAFTKTAYSFAGWNTRADGTGTVYTDNQSVTNLTADDRATVDLYAVWTLIPVYLLTVENGTGGGSSYAEGTTVPIDATAAAGYTFTKWTSDRGGTFENDTAEHTVFTMPASAVTVTAELRAHTYTVRYDGTTNTSGATADSVHTYDIAQNLTKNGFAKTDYYFAGWNTEPDGTGTGYPDEASVQNLTADDRATVTLYAVWELTPVYPVTVTGGGGSGSYPAGETVRIEATVPSGQTFRHWTTAGVTLDAPTAAVTTFLMPANPVTATAVFQSPPVPSENSDGNMENAYRVLFDTAGGSFISPATGLSAGDRVTQPAAPVKDGYTFGGWYTDGACTKEWSFSSTVPGDLTLYAKWVPTAATATATATATVTVTTTATAATPVHTTAAATTAATATATVPPFQTPASLAGILAGLLLGTVTLHRRNHP